MGRLDPCRRNGPWKASWRNAGIIERHSDLAMEDLELGAVPIFNHLVIGGKAGVDKGAKICTDRLASVPIGDSEVTHRILGKAVEALAEGLLVNFLPHV